MNTPHLTHEQISDLLIADPTVCDLDLPQTDTEAEVKAHLRHCAACSTEVLSLRQSLLGFREASSHYAAKQPEAQSIRVATWRLPARMTRFSMLAATAAAVLVAASLPFGAHRNPPAATPVAVAGSVPQVETADAARPRLSDEELLASIEQDLSASIPTSMQPLAEPIPSTQNTTQSSK